MCPLFGNRLIQRRADLLAPTLQAVPGLALMVPVIREQARLEAATLPPARSVTSAVPVPAVRNLPSFAKLVPGGDEAPRVVVREALSAALAVLATRPLLPAEALSTGEVVHWLTRIAQVRRISHLRLELVGLFPRLPLGDAATLQLDSSRQEARYSLSPGPVVLVTIAVARRRDTGESVVGRFVVE